MCSTLCEKSKNIHNYGGDGADEHHPCDCLLLGGAARLGWLATPDHIYIYSRSRISILESYVATCTASDLLKADACNWTKFSYYLLEQQVQGNSPVD